MNLNIKNMVCDRCILVVKQELKKLNINYNTINLGSVSTENDLSKEQIELLGNNLLALGFEILDDSKKQLLEKIKNIIRTQVHDTEEEMHQNYSELLSNALHKDYSYLSNLFSEVEGITIEKYIINQKIERVKALIMYDELNLSEIAFKLGYSSAAYLSNQFKKITGLTPSHFKKVGRNKRKPLDKI